MVDDYVFTEAGKRLRKDANAWTVSSEKRQE
jgi:hypothetical protein